MAGGEEMHGNPPPEASQKPAVKPENMMAFLQRVHGCVDVRLPEHERRVAYLLFGMADIHGGLEPMKLRELCLLAFLHDIGLALAPAEREAVFQNKKPVPTRHAVYGHLLCKEMLPVRLAEVLRYHHTPYSQMEQAVQPEVALYAQMLHLADRVSQLAGREGYTACEIDAYITASGAEVFGKDVTRLFRLADFANDICYKASTELYLVDDKERDFLLDPAETKGCLQLLSYVCDTKSGCLPTATPIRVAVASQLAACCKLSPLCQQQVAAGAQLYGYWWLTKTQTTSARHALLTGLVDEEVLGMLEGPMPEEDTEQNRGAGILALANQVSGLYDATGRPEGRSEVLLRSLEREVQLGNLPEEAMLFFGQHMAEVLQASQRAGQAALARHSSIKTGMGANKASLFGQWPITIT